jgi:hypothetical protein
LLKRVSSIVVKQLNWVSVTTCFLSLREETSSSLYERGNNVYLPLWREKVFHSRKNSKHVLRGRPAAIHRGPRPLGCYGWKVFCCMGVVHKGCAVVHRQYCLYIRAGMLQCEMVRFVFNLRQLCVQVPIFIW